MLVTRLSSRLAREEAKSEALGQQYDGDVSTLQELNHSIAIYKVKVTKKQASLEATSQVLVTSLIRTYVDGASSAQGLPLLDTNVTQSDAQQIYERQSSGNISAIEGTLNREKNALAKDLRVESNQKALAGHEIHQIRLLILDNNETQAATQATLSQVSTTLNHEIVSYEISVAVADAKVRNTAGVENAVAAASAVGGQAAANQVISAANAVTPKTNVAGTAAGTKDGLAAVHAAESQIGVPYVWVGETPGEGFDCSGLTQWSWAQAHFAIPRTAAEQYEGLRHVPLDQLQPGDLLFYYNLDDDNQVDHVVMYVGSGPYGTETIIAAAHTGTTVGYEPLFTYGLIGAGRP